MHVQITWSLVRLIEKTMSILTTIVQGNTREPGGTEIVIMQILMDSTFMDIMLRMQMELSGNRGMDFTIHWNMQKWWYSSGNISINFPYNSQSIKVYFEA